MLPGSSSAITMPRLDLCVINAWSAVGTEYSSPSDVRTPNGTNGVRCSCLRISSITVALYQKLAFPHHLFAVEPDVEIAAHAVDVSFGNPVSAGVFGVRMTKGNVNAGKFFILQNMADDVRAGDVCADGKFTDAVAIFVCAGVGAKFVAQILVVRTQ